MSANAQIIAAAVAAALAQVRVTAGGEFTGTTSVAGILTIPHGMPAAPTAATANYHGSATRSCQVTGIGATNIAVQVCNDAGVTVNSTSLTVDWIAII